LIYFDQETKGAILGRMADISAPDASLFLGGAESVIGISSDYQPVSGVRGVYQLASNGAAARPAPISAAGNG